LIAAQTPRLVVIQCQAWQVSWLATAG